jgi:lipopolysaccharide transport system permease protein
MTNKPEKWDMEIVSTTGLLEINWRELWQYRDLIYLFVRRDLTAIYKQTILGPLWFFVQPMLTTTMYMIVFGKIANISTGGLPKVLFYLAGITIWNYFQESLIKTSETFITNQNLFGKVYFPRLAVPISLVISGLIKFFIQFSLFILVWQYFLFEKENISINPNATMLLFPLYILVMSGLGFSYGILISSLTLKYRDLRFLIQFGIQLLMYATPVIYPLQLVSPKHQTWLLLNPVAVIIEAFKYGFTGQGYFSYTALGYAIAFTALSLFFSIIIFNRVEKTFVDRV